MNVLGYVREHGPCKALDIAQAQNMSLEECYGELIALESMDMVRVVVVYGDGLPGERRIAMWEAM